MNKHIIKLGLDSGMLNYVDHEIPRQYFLCGNADEECLAHFAELIIKECAMIANVNQHQYYKVGSYILKHFELEKTNACN